MNSALCFGSWRSLVTFEKVILGELQGQKQKEVVSESREIKLRLMGGV